MSSQLIIASERDEDIEFGTFLAFANNLELKHAPTGELMHKTLSDAQASVVFWDAEDAERASEMADVLSASVPAARVFAVTEKPLNSYPHLAKAPVFAHHLLRRFDEPSPTLYPRIIGASLHPAPFGLQRYFPETVTPTKITLTRSGQKRAAVDAIQGFFNKQDVNTRLSSLVAQACDELLMNAMFDAPILPNGMLLRRGTSRDADFELIAQEHVHLEMASSEDYVGICVSDQFGSLKKSLLMGFLAKDYHDEKYELRKGDPGAGLGLHGIVQSGLSLMFLCRPGVRTEVMIFFARGASYKSFRGGFRFLSVVAP